MAVDVADPGMGKGDLIQDTGESFCRPLPGSLRGAGLRALDRHRLCRRFGWAHEFECLARVRRGRLAISLP